MSSAEFIPPLAAYIWNNAGFGKVRKIKELDDYEPRYDPTVIPLDSGDGADMSKPVSVSYRERKGPGSPNTSIGAYHAAYESGEVTPVDVVEVVLDLIDGDIKHKVAFSSIVREKVRVAAQGSMRRYKEGKAKGILDGIPVAVKGM